MRVTDIFLAFPFLVALLVLRNVLAEIPWVDPIMGDKTSIRFMVILLAVVRLDGRRPHRARPGAGAEGARVHRGVAVARRLGTADRVRHLLPNSLGPILVALTFSVVAAILAESTLSFFGFGPQPGRGAHDVGPPHRPVEADVLTGNWWLVVFPCAVPRRDDRCINFVGDGLRDSFDPKAKKERA